MLLHPLSEAFWICVWCKGGRNDDTSENRLYYYFRSIFHVSSLPSPLFCFPETWQRLTCTPSLCYSRLIENSTLISRPFRNVSCLRFWVFCWIYLFRLLIGVTLWMTSFGSGCRFDFSCFAEGRKHSRYDSLKCHDQNIRLRESSNKCHGQRQTGRQTWRQRERDI